MNVTAVSQQGNLYSQAIEFLNEYERVISASLMALLVVSLCGLIVIKFENYRLHQSVAQASNEHKALLMQQQEFLVEQSKLVGYLSKNDYANKQWQVAQT